MGKHRHARRADKTLDTSPHPTIPGSGPANLTARSMTVLLIAALVTLVTAAVVAAATKTGTAPDAPQGLVVDAVAHDSVTLTWNDPEDSSVTGYQILRRNRAAQAAGEFDIIDDTVAANATSYTDTTVEASTRYVYRIKARNLHGLSTRSRFVRANTPAAPEPQPEPGPVWTAVLSVGSDGSSVPATAGYSRWSGSGSLSPDRFEVNGASVQVLVLIEHAGGLYFALRSELSADFVLSVGGTKFVGSESLRPWIATASAFWWPSEGVLGEPGGSVHVSLAFEGSGSLDGRAPAPPSARFSGVPDSHDGTTPFELQFVLDEEGLSVSAQQLRDHALTVTGATLIDVRATGSGTRSWTIRAQPAGNDDITVALPPAADCAQPAAVCAPDGRQVRNHPRVTVPGPDVAREVTVELPNGCNLRELTANGATLTASGRWRPACRSILTYKDDRNALPGYRTTGYARFYRFDVADTSDVAIRLTEFPTAHHYVLRAPDGTEIRHVMHAPDHRSGHLCGFFEYPCSPVPGIDATLDAGPYVLELVQHFSRDGRQREYELSITLTSQPVRGPRLSTLTIDGAAVPSLYPSARFAYRMDHAAGTVTVEATPETASPPLEVSISPTDADTNASGHQVEVPQQGVTDLTVSVSEPGGLSTVDYTVALFNDYPADTTTTATVTADGTHSEGSIDFPGDHDWFAVTLPAGNDHFAIDVKGEPSGDGTLGDPMLIGVYDATGSPIPRTTDDDSGTGANSRFIIGSGGAGTLYISVSGSDGTTGTYQLSVVRVATLDSLSLDGVPLNRLFSPAAVSYKAIVPTTRSQVTVAATTPESGAVVAISPADADPNTLGHQVALGAIGLDGRATTTPITVEVLANDGAVGEYTIDVTRVAPSDDDDADLASMSAPTLLDLAPSFERHVTSYSGTVGPSVDHVDLYLEASSGEATVQVTANDQPIEVKRIVPGITTIWQIELDAAPSVTTVHMTVISADATTRKTYSLDITRTSVNVR